MKTDSSELGAREAPRADLVRALFAWLIDQFAAAVVRRMRETELRAEAPDPEWGMVTQKTLPSWIHPDVYVEACRDGKIEGARSFRRQWIAPRPAVEAWWFAQSRPAGATCDVLPTQGSRPANDVSAAPVAGPDTATRREVDPESAEALLLAAGIDLSAVPHHMR